jgi:hypothetical protein
MAKKKVIEYHAQGYIYDDGDIPTCSFCGVGADQGHIIHAGDYSGQHICESENCTYEYMCQNVWTKPFEAKEVEVDDDEWDDEDDGRDREWEDMNL